MSKDKETLIILIPGFPESETDSTCLPFQQSFVLSLKKLCPQLQIIVLSFQYPYHTNEYRWFDIKVFPFSGKNKGGLSRLLLRKKIVAALRKIQTENKIIGLLSFWCGECAAVGKHFADKHQLRHFCWLMGQDAKRKNKYPKRMRPAPDELIALSDFLQTEFEKNHSIRPEHIIPPGIDTNLSPLTVIEKDVDILAVGSLIPLKQYSVFIETIAALKKHFPEIKAVLIGKGPEIGRLNESINQLDLQSNITLTGELSHQETLLWMQKARVFLHPSLYEGFGIVCIEALYCKATVISFVSPMRERIENWHIVNDKKEMIEKTLQVLQNSNTEYKQVVPYKLDDTVKQIMQLFLS